MTTRQLELLAVLEVVGFIMIFRLWRRNARRARAFKIVWTVVLLIPLLGPLLYGFVTTDSSAHGEDPPDASGGTDAGVSY